MLVTQLKKIEEIDERINQMHRELAALYDERSTIVEPASKLPSVDSNLTLNSTKPDALWVNQQYNQLKAAWDRLDIEIPSLGTLKHKLQKAQTVMKELGLTCSALENTLEVLLVPPTKLVGSPARLELRSRQQFCDGQDYLNHAIPAGSAVRTWRLLVVHAESTGLSLGTPAKILENKSYMIGGYDTRGLSVQEYTALSLQKDVPVDDGSWTLLLKDYKAGRPVVSATFMSGRFRFDIDEIGGLESDRFRPAVEIK